MERLVNAVIQASKKIKQIQKLLWCYFGFFAAVRYIINNVQDIGNKKSLVWYWKIGRNTCENLVKHNKKRAHYAN
jgi:glutamyl-tRNA reductase